MKKTLVIGSNGVLGRHIVDKVIEKSGIENIIISDYKKDRLLNQVRELKSIYNYTPLHRVIDVFSKDSIRNGIHKGNQIVIALQQREPLIQEVSIEKGINSVDLSVDPLFIKKALKLDANNNSVQLLTGGLFPGLSGVIANDLYIKDKGIEISVGLLQSNRGTNGKTGVLDMLKIFNKDVELIKGKKSQKHPGFCIKKEFDFGSNKGVHNLRLSSFIERELLKEFGITSNYYTAFDNKKINRGISFLKRAGLLNLTKFKTSSNILAKLLVNDSFSNKDESIGLNINSNCSNTTLILKSDYEATASCCLSFLNRLNSKGIKGVKFPFELFSFNEIIDDIGDVVLNFNTPSQQGLF